MTYQPVGHSGLVVSTIGLGCDAFGALVDASGVREIVIAAHEAGITFLDTADVYGASPGESEAMIGQVLRRGREEFVIATKFGGDMRGANGPDYGVRGSRQYIRRAVEASLLRLQTDYIDLYQMQMPDPVTPIEETLETLSDLIREGKIRYAGCSNFSGWQIADATWTARTNRLNPFISAQNRYSLLDHEVEQEVIPACDTFGVGMIPYFPLENGLLTGKYTAHAEPPAGSRGDADVVPRWLKEADWHRIEKLRSFAAVRDLAMTDVALAALAARPTVVSVIAGATSAEQVTANAAALNWRPSDDELAELDVLMSVR